MKVKRIICGVLAAIMAVGSSSLVFADDGMSKRTDSITVGTGRYSQNVEEASFDDFQVEQSVSLNMEVGEVKPCGVLEDGTKLFIKLISSSESQARGMEKENYKSYVIQYENMFGKLQDAVRMDLTCNWYKDGKNSYINYLSGEYTVYLDSFSCEWDDLVHQAPLLCILFLNISHGSSTTLYTFSASCNTVAANPYISFQMEKY